jgi:hypothetical protein
MSNGDTTGIMTSVTQNVVSNVTEVQVRHDAQGQVR